MTKRLICLLVILIVASIFVSCSSPEFPITMSSQPDRQSSDLSNFRGAN